MEIELREQHLTLSGNLNFKVQKTYREIARGKHDAILIVQFSGFHGEASGGNGNSNFMQTIIAAGMGLNLFDGFILDLTELEYTFGDSLMNVIALPISIRNKDFPYITIVSEKCAQGINSLLEFEGAAPFFTLENDLYLGIQKIYNILDNTRLKV